MNVAVEVRRFVYFCHYQIVIFTALAKVLRSGLQESKPPPTLALTSPPRRPQKLADRMPVPVAGRSGQFKRPEPPCPEPCSPTRKRLCSLAESPCRGSELQRSESHRLSPVSERVRPVQRCHSESEATIKRAVQRCEFWNHGWGMW